MKKLKTYVLTVSQQFAKTHISAGQFTGFVKKIATGEKKHTIRANYDLWEKRFKEIEAGRAVLSVRVWTGKPYNSKQSEVFRFNHADGIGIEKLTFSSGQFNSMLVNGKYCFSDIEKSIAQNDGLSFYDFVNWFKGYDLTKPMAIIHFSPFRYDTH